MSDYVWTMFTLYNIMNLLYGVHSDERTKNIIDSANSIFKSIANL